MHDAQEYTYRVYWSDEDREYVATVAEFPSLSNLAKTPDDALRGIIDLVAFSLGEMNEANQQAPVPLGSRRYSGKIALRMTPDQHRRVAMEAAEQGVSINTLLVSRI